LCDCTSQGCQYAIREQDKESIEEEIYKKQVRYKEREKTTDNYHCSYIDLSSNKCTFKNKYIDKTDEKCENYFHCHHYKKSDKEINNETTV
jgi:hypothetical protein